MTSNKRVSVMEKRILDSKVSTFFSKKSELRSLSNFWECEIVIEDRVYKSGEHCFHGEKYFQLSLNTDDVYRKCALEEYSKTFMGECTPVEAKKRGGKKGLVLSEEELKLWNVLSIEVQKKICLYKINNYEEVREDLRKSADKILVHPAMRCSMEKIHSRIWEGKAILDEDGNIKILGANKLGNIWMSVRNECM